MRVASEHLGDIWRQKRLDSVAGRREHFKFLSDAAFDVMELIGRGGRVLRHHADDTVDMIDLPGVRSPRNPDGTPLEALRHPLAISLPVYMELLHSGRISALTEKTERHRTGWKEMGLIADPGMEFYLLRQ